MAATQERQEEEKQEVFSLFGRKFKKFNMDEFKQTIADEAWDFAQGSKERKWSPDRRPASERGKSAGPGPDSRLAWGGAGSREEYEQMTLDQRRALKDKAALMLEGQPLGTSAVSVFGESVKGDNPDQEKAFFEDIMRRAAVPDGQARDIEDAVQLAEMVHGKYGYYHDVSILSNAGQVGFNVYSPFLGQRKFSYTEQQYLQKLESVVQLLRELDQAWYIKNFLLSPLKPRLGLPSTPRADTAVTLRLNTSPTWTDDARETVDAWMALRR